MTPLTVTNYSEIVYGIRYGLIIKINNSQIGLLISNTNQRSYIKQRIQLGYKAFYTNKQLFKYKNLSKKLN